MTYYWPIVKYWLFAIKIIDCSHSNRFNIEFLVTHCQFIARCQAIILLSHFVKIQSLVIEQFSIDVTVSSCKKKEKQLRRPLNKLPFTSKSIKLPRSSVESLLFTIRHAYLMVFLIKRHLDFILLMHDQFLISITNTRNSFVFYFIDCLVFCHSQNKIQNSNRSLVVNRISNLNSSYYLFAKDQTSMLLLFTNTKIVWCQSAIDKENKNQRSLKYS